MLRDPMQRYVSEWKHVARGAEFTRPKVDCRGRTMTDEKVPSCYKGICENGTVLGPVNTENTKARQATIYLYVHYRTSDKSIYKT